MDEKKMSRNEGEELSDETLSEVAGGGFLKDKVINPVLDKLRENKNNTQVPGTAELGNKSNIADLAKPL